MCSADNFLKNNTEYRVYLDTISRYKYVSQKVIFQKTKGGAQPRNFLKKSYYLENISTIILRCCCKLNC